MDVSSVIAVISGGGTAVTSIGMAALGVLATAALFKYIRRAF